MRSPALYKRIRNALVQKYRRHPSTHLIASAAVPEATQVRRRANATQLSHSCCSARASASGDAGAADGADETEGRWEWGYGAEEGACTALVVDRVASFLEHWGLSGRRNCSSGARAGAGPWDGSGRTPKRSL